MHIWTALRKIRRPRLVLAIFLGMLSIALWPQHWRISTRVMLSWDVAVWTYLVLMGWMMSRARPEQVMEMAEKEDESAVAILTLISVCATISLAAIVIELAGIQGAPADVKIFHYVLTGLTVLGAWALVAVVFSFHYALLFYSSPELQRALKFPDQECTPDFWDFLYFSFTIAVAAQTSDVSVMCGSARKTVLFQSVLSFFFNVAVLGFSINIAASLVSA
ncbi:DUF1345 domain-containing protein [Undibacterium sp. CY7W]|uniref:DUF1345 domain-containing protein n=1 Tax=Undibacterium rugosum TaxID=2762291 RepID=A0A923I239_9BURK|nr:DUF1345 domain-containing protein [Undibacterium rugosum]MBC3934584.1 DUF1345 domain-containing protein [Undibacterium rugosum]